MTADPMTVAVDSPLVEAAKILEIYRISSLPVLDHDTLVGILFRKRLPTCCVCLLSRTQSGPHETTRDHGARCHSGRA